VSQLKSKTVVDVVRPLPVVVTARLSARGLDSVISLCHVEQGVAAALRNKEMKSELSDICIR
jgi:hypothetical protein